MATDASEIIRLFADLASNLRRYAAEDPQNLVGESPQPSISSLISSLNPSPSSSETRVLNAALSLMCFDAPQVWSWNVRWAVESVVAVLEASVRCKVVRRGREERLVVGSSIVLGDCEKLVRACLDVVESLDEHGSCHPLLRAVLRVVLASPRYQNLFPISSSYYERNELPRGDKGKLVSKLCCILSEETSISEHKVPSRIILWYVDPLTLKNDISEILDTAIHRPFLCLKQEFYDRMNWRVVVICLVTSPAMFFETRALLHNWFLLSGLASVLELQTVIVALLLDILSRPMWWGLTMEIGLRLPFRHSYFCEEHRDVLAILCGPISRERLLDLVHLLGIPDAYKSDHVKWSLSQHSSTCMNSTIKPTLIGSNSTWAVLMCFPSWFYFAAIIVFCRNHSQQFVFPAFLPEIVDQELCHVAAMYIALILFPFDETYVDLLVDCLEGLASAWHVPVKANCDSQQSSKLNVSGKFAFHHSKRLKKLKADEREKLPNIVDGCSITKIWLQQFHDQFSNFFDNAFKHSEAKTKHHVSRWCNMLNTKICLGIVMVCPNYLSEESCELLLHYAATGEVLQVKEVEATTNNKSDGDVCADTVGATKWLLGASCVLDLLDIIKDMTCAMFDTDDALINYICQIKGRSIRYLVRCVKNILKLQEEVKEVVLVDLFNKMMWWKEQGREDFEGCRILDEVMCDLKVATTLSSMSS